MIDFIAKNNNPGRNRGYIALYALCLKLISLESKRTLSHFESGNLRQ